MAESLLTHEIQFELADLRAAVQRLEAAASSRPRLTLSPASERAWLGQPVVITVSAQTLSAQGAPLPAGDLPVTLLTSWGVLRSVDGYETQVGSSVTTRTGVDGLARVTLLPPGAAHVEQAQLTALRAALQRLDLSAPTPLALQSQLVELVSHYRWESNMLLRRAIDLLYRHHDLSRADAINSEDALAAWSYQNAGVVAFVADQGTPAASGLQSALCSVRFTDWLPPWLQLYRRQARADEELAGDLARAGAGAMESADEAGALLDSVYGRINSFVNRQYGIIGRSVGQSVAESALRTFVGEGLATLPAETRAQLAPTLAVASQTVATAGVHVLSALSQARVDLRQEIGAKAGGSSTVLGGRVGALEEALSATQVERSQILGAQEQLGTQLAALGQQSLTLEGRVAAVDNLATTLRDEVNATVGGLSDSVRKLTTRITKVQGEFSEQLRTEVAVLGEQAVAFEGRIAAVDSAATALRDEVNATVGGLSDTVRKLTSRVTKVQSEVTDQIATLEATRVSSDEFKAFQVSTEETLRTKATVDEISTLRAEFEGRIGGKADSVVLDLFQQETAARISGLESQTTTVATDLTVFQRSLSGLDRNFNTLNKRILDAGLLRP